MNIKLLVKKETDGNIDLEIIENISNVKLRNKLITTNLGKETTNLILMYEDNHNKNNELLFQYLKIKDSNKVIDWFLNLIHNKIKNYNDIVCNIEIFENNDYLKFKIINNDLPKIDNESQLNTDEIICEKIELDNDETQDLKYISVDNYRNLNPNDKIDNIININIYDEKYTSFDNDIKQDSGYLTFKRNYTPMFYLIGTRLYIYYTPNPINRHVPLEKYLKHMYFTIRKNFDLISQLENKIINNQIEQLDIYYNLYSGDVAEHTGLKIKTLKLIATHRDTKEKEEFELV